MDLLRTKLRVPPLRPALVARRRLLGGGHSTERRVEAVRVLATVTAPCRTGALERIACEGDEPVRHAAAGALAARRGEVRGKR